MDQIFNHLISRATPQPEIKVGSPWLCIPIKNDKQARDTTEVHMANQGYNDLSGFEKFKNIEVVWLNNNQLQAIRNMDVNFRVKQLYIQDNKIRTLEGSIEYMKHLETLIASNNELRDLQKNIEFLEEYPYLKQLDLYNNPLAEEPNYRLRVIHGIPQLVLLDRHVITLEERRKAEKWAKDDKEVKIKKKQKPKPKITPSQAFSKNEKILYKEVEQINERKAKEQEEEEQRERERIKAKVRSFDPDKLPTNQMREELRKRRQENPISIVTEWEKGKYKKLFKQYDKEKKGFISFQDLEKLYEDLINDKGQLGKIPDISLESFLEIMKDNNYEGETIQWDSFCFNLNHIYYKRAEEDSLKERIDKNYYEFNKKINTGKVKEGRDILYDGIRLENARDMEEAHKHLMRKNQEEEKKKRFDTFDFGKYKYKQNFVENAKYIL